MSPRRRSAFGVLILVLFSLSITACTAPAPEDHEVRHSADAPSHSADAAVPGRSDTSAAALIDIEHAYAEYDDAVTRLNDSLPTGARLPEEMPGRYDEDGQFEEGYGTMTAGVQWQCAWIAEYEDAQRLGDRARLAAALDELASWTSLPEVAPYIEPESMGSWESEVMEPARSGDDEVLRTIGAQC